jgi:hypothetical protein
MDVFIICQINITMLFINLISMLMVKYSDLKTDRHGLHTNIAYMYIYIATDYVPHLNLFLCIYTCICIIFNEVVITFVTADYTLLQQLDSVGINNNYFKKGLAF